LRQIATEASKKGGLLMHEESKVAICTLIILGFASVALASDSEPPRIDLQKTCRVVEKAIGAVFGDAITGVFDRCVENEKGSREQLVKDWSTYTAGDKSLCMKPQQYQPSYAEWLTCAEMQRDVRRLRKERSSLPDTSSSGRLPVSQSNLCPIVQHGADGAIISAIACALY
jgi:hypothetical protein